MAEPGQREAERAGAGLGDLSPRLAMPIAGGRPASPPGRLKDAADHPNAAADANRAVSTTAGGVLSARVTAEELRAFDALIASLGLRGRSEALRIMVRGAAGFLELGRDEVAALSEIAHELHKIGVNVNQIALAANRGRVPMMHAEWQAVNELRAVLPPLRLMLNRIVDARRRGGAARFAAGVAEARHG